MKKIREKQRQKDVLRTIRQRRGKSRRKKIEASNSGRASIRESVKNWLNKRINDGLNVVIDRRTNKLILELPEIMNFSSHYDSTVLHIDAIRKLCDPKNNYKKVYKLASVDFDNLKKISTSAALVLTAEISKWDDAIRKRLKPNITGWDRGILRQFCDLGYFDLFQKVPEIENIETDSDTTLVFVRYIKGKCGDKGKTRELKESITRIVGDIVKKWTFLHTGLSEAITNVSHHAYPESCRYLPTEKYWYLTGSYNDQTKELKIVFYDQGIGIPKSLPASEIWERVLAYLSRFKAIEHMRDEVLLKAAVELDRTRTGESDRGKGLQDLLEFVKQRKDGNLSIISKKGLYRYTMENGREKVKTEGFQRGLDGTLIIWSAVLSA